MNITELINNELEKIIDNKFHLNEIEKTDLTNRYKDSMELNNINSRDNLVEYLSSNPINFEKIDGQFIEDLRSDTLKHYREEITNDLEFRAEVRREFKDIDTQGLVSSSEWYNAVINAYADNKMNDVKNGTQSYFIEAMQTAEVTIKEQLKDKITSLSPTDIEQAKNNISNLEKNEGKIFIDDILDVNKTTNPLIYEAYNGLYEATVIASSFSELKEKHDSNYGGDFRNTVTITDKRNGDNMSFNTIRDRDSDNFGQYIDNQSAISIVRMKNEGASIESIKSVEEKGIDLARSYGFPKLDVEAQILKNKEMKLREAPAGLRSENKILSAKEERKLAEAKAMERDQIISKIKGTSIKNDSNSNHKMKM